jgi:Phytanoyl-CoA dioxygenase (PhyH)
MKPQPKVKKPPAKKGSTAAAKAKKLAARALAAKKPPLRAAASKSTTLTASNKKRAPPPTTKFLSCPETGDRVFVGTATLADMKNPPTGHKRKILFKVPSAKTRQSLYDELALCLEDRESRLLPKYGGRPWKVLCQVNDSATTTGSPFFRFFRGNLELAVLPHLLERIPDPPRFPGYQQTEQGVRRQMVKDDDDDSGEEVQEEYENMTEEEAQRMESLAGREISSLSQVAWEHRNDRRSGAPVPNISIKWSCPLRQIFVSRKAAWDHAVELAKAEQFVDRFVRGRGKNGALLKPFRPTKSQTLQAGKVRFLRDGLWVVGQEQSWQNERYRKQFAKEKSAMLEEDKVDKEPSVIDAAMTDLAKKRQRITGSSLFRSVYREAHREKRMKQLKVEAKVAPKRGPKDQIEKPQLPSKTTAKLGMPTLPGPTTIRKKPGQVKFSLAEVDKELRVVWKEQLSEEQRRAWEAKAASSFHQKLYDDDQLRLELAQAKQQQEEEIDVEEDENDDVVNEGDDESNAAEERADNLSSDQDIDVVNSGADRMDEDASDEVEREVAVVELATQKERDLWEILSEAELVCWKTQATKILPNDEHSSSRTLAPFLTVQRTVYEAYMNLTPEEYEQRNLKRLKGAERRKYKHDYERQKELLANGVKLLFNGAHQVVEKEIGHWLTKGFRNIRRKVERVAADPPGAKYDHDPELNTLCHVPLAAATLTRLAPMETSSSMPISPSPPLGEPASATPNRGSQVEEVQYALEENGDLASTINENTAKINIVESCEKAKAVTDAEADDVESQEELDSAMEEEEEDDSFFVPTNKYCLSELQIRLCYEACMTHFDDVMRTVKAKDLTRELEDGFDVLRERGRGRYDMELPAFDTEHFDFLNDDKKAPWMPIVKQVLGDDVVLIHKGCFLSLPDSTNQNYHQDGPHLHPTSQKPCHAVNVFTPLVDMTIHHGPTEFCLGSHILSQEDWDRRYIYTPVQKKGVPVMFDYRLGHRGLANTSNEPRPIVYCTYARARDGKEFRDAVNFSRKRYRKLGEIVEKPMSREERTQKRQAVQEAAYGDWWTSRLGLPKG